MGAWVMCPVVIGMSSCRNIVMNESGKWFVVLATSAVVELELPLFFLILEMVLYPGREPLFP